MENFATQLISTIAALILAIAVAWLALRALKRMQYGNTSGDELTFLRALPIGPRERVVLVEYRGEEYMLGVTSGGISLLQKCASTEKNQHAGLHESSSLLHRAKT